MVLHFVLPTKLWIFIFERVVTMWARRHDLLHIAACKCLDIGVCALLKKKLVANSARGIAGAGFLFTEHGEVHSCIPKQLYCRTGHLLGAWIERRGAAYPEQIFKGWIRFNRRHFEPLRPSQALGIRPPVGI